jgi:hypothetical protein
MTAPETPKLPFLTDRSYNLLKFIAQIFLPAVASAYFSLSQIWHLPNATEIVGTIAVLDAFLGVILSISTKWYENSEAKYDGTIEVDSEGGKKMFSLILNSDVDELDQKKEASFKITPRIP